MALNGISTLMIPSGITATSYQQASSYLVAVGTFNYDAYGAGFAIRKDNGSLDAYMAQVIALGSGNRNWTFVPSNGQSSFTKSMRQPATNASNDPSESGIAIWVVNCATTNLGGTSADQINTSLIPNGTSFTIYANDLGAGGGGADKQARQIAKLNLAAINRASVNNPRSSYDIDRLPTKYSTNSIVDNPNEGGLIQGRPWVELVAGVYRTVHSGYFNENVNYFTSPSSASATNDIYDTLAEVSATTSFQYTGYFLAPDTTTYTFYLSSDDAGFMWVGPTAVSGYTTANALLKNPGLHGMIEVDNTISMVAGSYYPIRVQFGNNGGAGGLEVNYATSSIAKNRLFTGRLFYNPVTNGI